MTPVFISYSKTVYRGLIEELKIEIRSAGFQPIDARGDEGPVGLHVDEADSITSMIRRSGLFVAIIFEDSPDVFFELGIAVAQQKRTLLAYGHDIELPAFARRLNTMRVEGWKFQAVVEIIRWVQENAPRVGSLPERFSDLRNVVATARTDPTVWDLITPQAFVDMIGSWFRHRGCIVEDASGRLDYGFDLILRGYKHYERTLVQIKKYTSNAKISIPTVQQLLGAIHMYEADAGLLIATGGFTRSAVDFAEKCSPPIQLLSADELTDML